MRTKQIVALFVALASVGCAVAVGQPGVGAGTDSVWVCHGGRNPKWQRVAAPAAEAHRRHGDTVSTTPKPEGEACENP